MEPSFLFADQIIDTISNKLDDTRKYYFKESNLFFIHKFSQPMPLVAAKAEQIQAVIPVSTEPTILIPPTPNLTLEQQLHRNTLASDIVSKVAADTSLALIKARRGLMYDALSTIVKHQHLCVEYFLLGPTSPFDMAYETCQSREALQKRIQESAFFTSKPDEKKLQERRERRHIFVQ